MSDFDDLFRAFLDMKHELAELQHKHTNMLRVGTIEKADGKKGYQVNFGNDENGKPIPSAWHPHPEQGGAFKTWRPLDKGQIVYVFTPDGGDQRQAHIIPKGGFSDQNKQPSEKLDENVETYGKIKTTWKAESTKKEVGDKVSVTTTTKDRVTKTEKVMVSQEAAKHTVKAEGTKLTTEGKKVVADTPLFKAKAKVILASGL